MGIVMDNASYHSIKTPKLHVPTSSRKKVDIQACLMERNILWTGNMLKCELYDMVKLLKPPVKYVADEMALQQGFIVVCLPAYHCFLNPVQMI